LWFLIYLGLGLEKSPDQEIRDVVTGFGDTAVLVDMFA